MAYESFEQRLLDIRVLLWEPYDRAKEAGDEAEMKRLTDIAVVIDSLSTKLALESLATAAASLEELAKQIGSHTAEAQVGNSSFGVMSLQQIEHRVEELFDQIENTIYNYPKPKPKVKIKSNIKVVPKSLATSPESDVGPGAGHSLVLSEEHLIALWKRSLYPIETGKIIVFGLRGVRPVSFGEHRFASTQGIMPMPLNFLTMNCTIGQWLPGEGIALFPGSTVPFREIVRGGISKNGQGVNQLGRGRYRSYDAGWHKRGEGSAGHWALRQNCEITLQRTGDDLDYDAADRWWQGWEAGDNIHCAFNMGEGDAVANVSFSSAGCQVVAGTVKKGVRDSESGPWAAFIAPFKDRLGSQRECEYVLFSGEEVIQMIQTQCVGKTVLLRFGSVGPLVRQLQSKLRKKGALLKETGVFDSATFRAVIDIQAQRLGAEAVDGIVGPQTASILDLVLHEFNFSDAIDTGLESSDFEGIWESSVEPVGENTQLVWGKVTSNKHGREFNKKVIEISGRLNCDPNNLMAVMAFETGGTFEPNQPNLGGSGAIGLIQFMPKTASYLGTSSAALAAMSAIEQLDYVEQFLIDQSKGKPLYQLSDLYMCVLWPKAVGKPDSYVLFTESEAYKQNSGLDANNNGAITKLEATAKVQAMKVKGLTKSRFG